ncbi:hypothetical protein ACFQ51_46165 [Streptomyces kaempferi]
MLTCTPVDRSARARRQLAVVTPGTSSAARLNAADAARSVICSVNVGSSKGSSGPSHISSRTLAVT